VPADAFYEWQKLDAKTKQPFAIALKSDEPYAFAGLREKWKDRKAETERNADPHKLRISKDREHRQNQSSIAAHVLHCKTEAPVGLRPVVPARALPGARSSLGSKAARRRSPA
jgi:hypothetical protein